MAMVRGRAAASGNAAGRVLLRQALFGHACGHQQNRLCRRRTQLLWLTAACVLAGLLVFAHAQSPSLTEYEVKAAFLYNFGKFVEWPSAAFPNTGEYLVIGVLGENPFGTILDEAISGKTIQGKKLVVKRFTRVKDALNCHILFISSSEESRLTEILTTLANTSVLTVGEMQEFARRGGMIRFRMENNKVRFEINLAATERAGLTVRSQLLKLATVVSGNRGPGD